jgi:hypothetical protein
VKNTRGKREELATVASAMLDHKLNLVEGVRKLTTLMHDIGEQDLEIFTPIRAIESETEHFPVGPVRDHYAPEYLKRLDEEMSHYLAGAQGDILAACRIIVQSYSPSKLKLV